jgi:hypothetical protein
MVPTIRPSPVSSCVGIVAAIAAALSFSFARPKSSTLTRPSLVTMTLAGFRSRCVMPRW